MPYKSHQKYNATKTQDFRLFVALSSLLARNFVVNINAMCTCQLEYTRLLKLKTRYTLPVLCIDPRALRQQLKKSTYIIVTWYALNQCLLYSPTLRDFWKVGGEAIPLHPTWGLGKRRRPKLREQGPGWSPVENGFGVFWPWNMASCDSIQLIFRKVKNGNTTTIRLAIICNSIISRMQFSHFAVQRIVNVFNLHLPIFGDVLFGVNSPKDVWNKNWPQRIASQPCRPYCPQSDIPGWWRSICQHPSRQAVFLCTAPQRQNLSTRGTD